MSCFSVLHATVKLNYMLFFKILFELVTILKIQRSSLVDSFSKYLKMTLL